MDNIDLSWNYSIMLEERDSRAEMYKVLETRTWVEVEVLFKHHT